MRLVLLATLAALALVAVPAEHAPVGTAAAVVCDVDDIQCHQQQLRCHLGIVEDGRPRACPR